MTNIIFTELNLLISATFMNYLAKLRCLNVALLMVSLYNGEMNNIGHIFYNVVISLWVGGISIFTFIITPVIFRSFERDMAGKIVGKIFPGYFTYNIVLSILVLIFLLAIGPLFSKFSFKLSLVLVVSAVIINLFIAFKLHPEIKKVKQEIHSFQAPSEESSLRKTFGKLHGASASLNLLLLANGITLLILSSMIKKQ